MMTEPSSADAWGGRAVMKALVLPLCLLLVVGCHREKTERGGPKASFGVVFGGQIQERRQIPFELDSTKQTLGFRIDFDEPVNADTKVEWRLYRPSLHKTDGRRGEATPTGEPSVGEEGMAVVRGGEKRFEQGVSFHPGDPLGLWNARLVVDGRIVLDRPFEVYDAAAREKATRRDGG